MTRCRFPTKPPPYWTAAKRKLGMNERAIFRIWWTNYTDEKRMMAWLAAPDADWRVNNMEKPKVPR